MPQAVAEFTISLPEDACEDLGLSPGMDVAVVRGRAGEWVLRRRATNIERWVGRLQSSRSVADELAELRGRPPDDFR